MDLRFYLTVCFLFYMFHAILPLHIARRDSMFSAFRNVPAECRNQGISPKGHIMYHTCTQLERAVGKNEKLESFKLESPEFESFAEVGKSQAKLERTDRSWKFSFEV